MGQRLPYFRLVLAVLCPHGPSLETPMLDLVDAFRQNHPSFLSCFRQRSQGREAGDPPKMS